MPLTKNSKTQNNHTTPGTATGAALGGAVGHHEGHTGAGALVGGATGHHFAGNHQADPAVRPSGLHDPAQLTAPGAMTTVDGTPIPASGVVNHKNRTSVGEKAFIGKLEHAAGTLLCSSSLRAKGLQKEREAQALKVQSAEISAAERLEQEAKTRRERAVAHGASPQVLHTTPGNSNGYEGPGAGLNNTAAFGPGGDSPYIPNQTSNNDNLYGHGHYDGRYPPVGRS